MIGRRKNRATRPLQGGPLAGRAIPLPTQSTLEVILRGARGYYQRIDTSWGRSISMNWVTTR